MNKQYAVVIYDCDGVILDSIESNYIFYNRIMAGLGRPPINRLCKEAENVLHTYSYQDVIEYFFGGDPQKEQALVLGKTIRYRELMPYMRREEGLLEALQQLQGRVELAICTNRAASMEMIIEDFGLEGFFSCVMTASKVSRPKPDPEPLHRVLEHYGIAPEQALFIGDSAVDLQAATAASVPFLAYKSMFPGVTTITHHCQVLDHL